MKKMGLLIALATVLTVGGVYATWQFSDKDVNSHSNTITNIGITPVAEAVSAGEITSTCSLSLEVDQVPNSFNGKLQAVSPAGSITFTFTPISTATAEWTNGVRFTWTIAVTQKGSFEGNEILLETGTGMSYTETVGPETADNTCTVTAAQVLTAVKFNEAIEVNDKDEHDDLGTELSSCQITITASVVAD